MTYTRIDMAPPAELPPGPHVVGLDTSLTGTGIASSRTGCHVVGYVDKTKKAPLTKMPHHQRLQEMHRILHGVLQAANGGYDIGTDRPDLVVMELPAVSRSGGGAHERGWLWWEVYAALTAQDVPVALMSPNQRTMYATGKGTAPKTAVVDAVARRFPDWETRGNDNAADALTLMAAGLDWLEYPLSTMPQTHRRAIDNADWPALILLGETA